MAKPPPNGPTEAVGLLTEMIRRIGHGYCNFGTNQRGMLFGCGIQWSTVSTRKIRGREAEFAA